MRDARVADADFVASLVPRFVEHGSADGHSPREVIEGTTRVLRGALAVPCEGDVFLIAEDESGERLGFVYAVTEHDFFTAEPYLHVSELAVLRSGDGTGARLMDAAEAHARARGYDFITLNVVEENTAALRFYTRRGYGPGHRHLVKPLS